MINDYMENFISGKIFIDINNSLCNTSCATYVSYVPKLKFSNGVSENVGGK